MKVASDTESMWHSQSISTEQLCSKHGLKQKCIICTHNLRMRLNYNGKYKSKHFSMVGRTERFKISYRRTPGMTFYTQTFLMFPFQISWLLLTINECSKASFDLSFSLDTPSWCPPASLMKVGMQLLARVYQLYFYPSQNPVDS